MSHQYISFVDTEPTNGCLHIHDKVYAYNPHRKFKWLQRACIWVLDRLLCQAVTEWTTYRRIDVAPMAVMDALFKQKTSLMRQLGRGNETLLIGSADYEELMCGEATRLNPMMFQTTYNFRSMDEYGRTGGRVLGLKVVVIPWMRGVLIIPDGMLPDRPDKVPSLKMSAR